MGYFQYQHTKYVYNKKSLAATTEVTEISNLNILWCSDIMHYVLKLNWYSSFEYKIIKY